MGAFSGNSLRRAGAVAVAVAGLAWALFSPAALAQSTMNKDVTVLAAGSLREVMKDLGDAFRKQSGIGLSATFGPSGGLRKDIEGGRQIDVFASADLAHTDALAARKLLVQSQTFAYNDLCVVAMPALGLNEANLLDVLLRPTVRLATSTPVSDPMGDYTWQFFRNADKLRPGTFAVFDAKALKLSGASAPLPGQKLPYVTAFEDGKTDAYIMYCTNAASTLKALPQLDVVCIPEALNVRSSYGIGAAPGSRQGEQFVRFVLGEEGRRILRAHGFN